MQYVPMMTTGPAGDILERTVFAIGSSDLQATYNHERTAKQH